MIWSRTLLAAVVLAVAGLPATAQDLTLGARVPDGADITTISEAVTGDETAEFRFNAEVGQTVRVTLTSDNPSTYFNLYAPGRGPGDEALAVGEFTSPPNDWSRTLTQTGEYTVTVYLYRAAARQGETSNFTLNISVDNAANEVLAGDFADSLGGGPDVFAVSVSPGGSLNLRASPTSSSAVLAGLPNGQGLRNLGCRMVDGGRWCNVLTLTDPEIEGWVSGDYVVEADASSMPLPMSAPAGAPEDTRVDVAAGSPGAELLGLLAPGDSRRYVLQAYSGQTLNIRVVPEGPPITYRIINPDSTVLQDRLSSIRDYAAELTQSGDHIVEITNRTDADVTYSVVFAVE
ncbi:SH3 domain-containing protein [Psychromarinibacter sp. S121]|uniref:SH3 domain-containing protein n=1 Tax=Psychromarinibacter sp. S121 TaxID=3415127 RepID=UPI003C7BAFC7